MVYFAEIIILSISLALFTSCQAPQNKDSVVDAKTNSAMGSEKKISPANTEFLIQMAVSHKIAIVASELAEKRSTSKKIKEYASKMVMDHEMMLEEIQSLAQMNGVTLPTEVNEEKNVALDKLQKFSRKKFDRLYLAFVQEVHKADIKKFNNIKIDAEYVNDPAVGAYAQNRLPMIEDHLIQIQNIQKNRYIKK